MEYSIRNQIEILNFLIDELKFFSKKVDDRLVIEPEELLTELVVFGLPNDVADRYRTGYLTFNIDEAKAAVYDIQNKHIPFLERVLDKLYKAEKR